MLLKLNIIFNDFLYYFTNLLYVYEVIWNELNRLPSPDVFLDIDGFYEALWYTSI